MIHEIGPVDVDQRRSSSDEEMTSSSNMRFEWMNE